MKKNTPGERLINGILMENPTLVLTLGMCPTLAVTTSAINGLGMGLTTTAVLMFSNLIISLLRNFIPDRVRIPSYIVVIASLVTIVQFVLQAYVPALNDALGVYIPLIVVNCIILGRAESYAGKNGPISSFFDGIGMGLGFTCSLTILGLLREILGSGNAFNHNILPESFYTPITIFILAPGAFLVLACMVAVQNRIKNMPPKAKKAEDAEKTDEEADPEKSDAEKVDAAKNNADKAEDSETTGANDKPEAEHTIDKSKSQHKNKKGKKSKGKKAAQTDKTADTGKGGEQ